MTQLVILGAGTAGTMLANTLPDALGADWQITLVDQDDAHHYQPGFLFIPFGGMPPGRVTRSRRAQVHNGVTYVESAIERIDAEAKSVALSNGQTLPYDYLIIATGCAPRPDQTEGMADPKHWGRTVHTFYTLDGATALRDALAGFEGGRLVVHITEMPIKCPVAPLEFAFLADDYFRKRRIRHKVDITYVTPLDGAFTKPVASKTLGTLLDDRSIRLATDFAVERVDGDAGTLIGYDGREIPFDLLVTVPLNLGAQCVIDSGLGDASGFVPVDKHTLQSTAHPEIFAVGDATDVPTSKAGSVAHFQVDHFAENFLALIAGRPAPKPFDGHANCFVETGRGKGLLLDFNYEVQPLTGSFPLPVVGPMKLLRESRINHLGKLAFERIYWDVLLPGRPMPIAAQLSMAGKKPA